MTDEDRAVRPDGAGGRSRHPDVDVDAPTRLTGEPQRGESVEPGPTRVSGEGASSPSIEDAPTQLAGADTGSDAEAPPVDAEAPTEAAKRSYRASQGAPEDAQAGKPRPGSVLFGEYEILEVLGAGGMGEVYRARHRRLNEYRAIKMMHAELSHKKAAYELFLREARALLAVRHPAVVHCHDLLSDDAHVYLIMEMIDGISLSERMKQGPLPPDEVVILGARVAAGLKAAHKEGVVHRDVSPDNVVLPDGDVARAKLIDFGIAKILQEGQGTIMDGFKGKLSYASPEQLGFFGGKIDGRSDFYSLGLVLCAAALGRPMGMGTTVMEAVDARRHLQRIPDEVPVGLRSAIEPLLALDPADRPTLVERLFVAPGGEQPALESVGPAAPQQGRDVAGPARGRQAAIAAGVLTAVLAGVLLIGREAPEQPELERSAPEPAASAEARRADATPLAPPRTADTPRATSPSNEPKASSGAAEVAKLAPEPATPAPRRPTAAERLRIVGLLGGAQQALEEDRLQSPVGNNAYEKYREVLEIDPNNEQAKAGLVRVAKRYLQLAEGALAAGNVEKARLYVSKAGGIAPHHPKVLEMREAVDRADAS